MCVGGGGWDGSAVYNNDLLSAITVIWLNDLVVLLFAGMAWSKEPPVSPSFYRANFTHGDEISAKIKLPRFPENAKYVLRFEVWKLRRTIIVACKRGGLYKLVGKELHVNAIFCLWFRTE